MPTKPDTYTVTIHRFGRAALSDFPDRVARAFAGREGFGTPGIVAGEGPIKDGATTIGYATSITVFGPSPSAIRRVLDEEFKTDIKHR